MEYITAFVAGGLICVLGQILIDKTSLTPARILTGFVIAGVLLTALGVYEPLVKVAGEGACVPISGFGYLMANGVQKAVDELGAIGILSGGLVSCAAGVAAAIVFSFLAAAVSKSGSK